MSNRNPFTVRVDPQFQNEDWNPDNIGYPEQQWWWQLDNDPDWIKANEPRATGKETKMATTEELTERFGVNQYNECLEYLDELRDSGETNMFGASAYLERDCGLDRQDAKDMLANWMQTFVDRHGD